MEEIGGERTPTLGERTIRGALALLLRHALLLPLGLLTNIFLARWLAPADFGTYAIAMLFLSTAAQFGDLGLHAALIQKPDPPTTVQLRTVFTVRLALALLLCGLLMGATPALADAFHIAPSARRIIPWLALTLPLGAIGSISLALLERNLAYPRLVRIEIMATMSFSVTALIGAYKGAGVWSFVGASVSSESVRLLLLLHAAAWPMGCAWDLHFLRAALRFGAPLQAGTWTALLRDNLSPLLAGPLFGPRAVGFLNWAHGVAYQTSQVVTQALSRVSFPALARAQADREMFHEILEKMLRGLMLVTVPLLAVAAGLIPWIVSFLYTDKWVPAIPAVYWFALRMLGGNITTPLIAALNALGRPRDALRILIGWTASDWAMALGLAPLFGFTGVAMAYGVSVWVPVIWLLRALRPVVPLDGRYALVRPAIAGILTFLFARALGSMFARDILSLCVTIAMGLAAYPLALLLVEGRAWIQEIRRGREAFRHAIRTMRIERERDVRARF